LSSHSFHCQTIEVLSSRQCLGYWFVLSVLSSLVFEPSLDSCPPGSCQPCLLFALLFPASFVLPGRLIANLHSPDCPLSEGYFVSGILCCWTFCCLSSSSMFTSNERLRSILC
ncbi:hypothetical protein COCON_G00095210, partial [Conger conger]